MVRQIVATDPRGGKPHLSQQPHKKLLEKRQRAPRGQSVASRIPISAWIIGGVLLVAILAYLAYSGVGGMEFAEWIKVLIAPLVLAIGAFLFNRSLKMHELNIAEQRAQDDAVQSYLDHMATLLMEKKLRHKDPADEASICARAGTLLVLRRLYPERKRTLLLFLCESGLIRKLSSKIRKHPTPVIDLYGADLKGIDLSGCTLPDVVLADADLSEADLSNAALSNADLSRAILKEANLSGAILKTTSNGEVAEANLTGADLSGANLNGAIVSQEQLEAASSLEGATMPDGSKHD